MAPNQIKRVRKVVFRRFRRVLNAFGFDLRRTQILNSEIHASRGAGGASGPGNPGGSQANLVQELAVVYLSVGRDGLDLLENSVASIRGVGFSGTIQVFHDAAGEAALETIARKHRLDLERLESPTREKLAGDVSFGAGDFARITHLKWQVILRALSQPNTVVLFADSDVVFLKAFEDFFLSASKYYMVGIQSESRSFFPPAYCIGLMFFTPQARDLLVQLSRATDSNASRGTAQQILNELILANPQLVPQILTLPEAVFPVGLSYPLLAGSPHPLQVHTPEVLAFHANWVVGNNAKRTMLDDLGLWAAPTSGSNGSIASGR